MQTKHIVTNALWMKLIENSLKRFLLPCLNMYLVILVSLKEANEKKITIRFSSVFVHYLHSNRFRQTHLFHSWYNLCIFIQINFCNSTSYFRFCSFFCTKKRNFDRQNAFPEMDHWWITCRFTCHCNSIRCASYINGSRRMKMQSIGKCFGL